MSGTVQKLQWRAPTPMGSALAAALVGFAVSLPYPALPIGNRTGLQIGHVVCAVAAIPLLWRPIWTRVMSVPLLLLFPMAFSFVRVVVSSDGDPDLAAKVVVSFAGSMMALAAVQMLRPALAAWLLTGVALATLVHVGVGLWQEYVFVDGGSELPLIDMYVNPSFASVQEHSTTFVKYIKRPFGLYPEPSAMAAATAPWVMLWISIWLGLTRLREPAARWQYWLFGAAALGGLALILISQSGHAIATVIGVLVLGFAWAVRARVSMRSYAALVAAACVALPLLLWATSLSVGERVFRGGEFGNDSWSDRTASLGIGLSLVANSGISTIVFGLGPGQSSPALQSTAHLDAVWSVLLTYVYETGLVGIVALLFTAVIVIRAGRGEAGSSRLSWGLVAAIWTVGVLVTTSYSTLLGVWAALGWITIWPRLCEAPGLERATRPADHSAHTPLQRSVAVRRWGAELHR